MNALITLPHLWDHARPIWDALDPSVRGNLYVGFDHRMQAYASAQGYEPIFGLPPKSDVPVLVASGNDLVAVKWAILASHGVDQVYEGVSHVCWAGGPGRQNVVLFLCPNGASSGANRTTYPNAHYAVVGSPHVEALRSLPPYPWPHQRIALSAHWDVGLVPEMRSALAWYETAYEKCCRDNPTAFVLHGHPRCAQWFEWKAREWGIEYCPDLAELTQRAWLFVTDSSSASYEWAALGRPVVHLNAPWWRKEISHGLRFWEYADLGVQVEAGDELEAAIQVAIADPAPIAQRRQQIVRELFGEDLSEGAAARAARAIEAVL